MLKKCFASLAVAASAYLPLAEAAELVVATVNNDHMIEMQKLTPAFEAAHPGITLKWVTLEEGILRQRVTTDIATKGGQFDVMTIGVYEAPIWASKGWLSALDFGADYDVDDLLPTVRSALSYKGNMHAAPFYGESSMVMYRKDLTDAAGISLAERPTWKDIESAAVAIHNPEQGVYGICLRGKAGWGENVAIVSTMVNAFGGQWFDMDWKPQMQTQAWKDALSFYVNLLQKYGPPGSTSNGFNELLALTSEGKCGMWVDATIAASSLTNPDKSKVADKIAFTQAPKQVTERGANWLWSWALAVPSSSNKQAEAKAFIEWATSRQYIQLVGETLGWSFVPTGTRQSTYENSEFLSKAVFAKAELQAIESADPQNNAMNPTPYEGIQFVAIPEFQAIGTTTGQMIAAALAGSKTVDQALQQCQRMADRQMRRGRYY